MRVDEVDASVREVSGFSMQNGGLVGDSIDFPAREEVGQLYAYRMSDSNVVLRTRESYEIGQPVAIGIQVIANGTYVCVSANANEQRMRTLTIGVIRELKT